MSLHTTLLTKVLVNFITPWDLLHTSNGTADSLTREVGIPKALSMQLLFRALKNWALQVYIAKDDSILRDVSF